ncbi:MAG: amidase family protein [Comamonadaceae bacterium]|nr:amidase family protein [Comamonadaceae bacterium]
MRPSRQPRPRLRPLPARAGARTRQSGPLAGLTFAVKDLFDVAGYPTGGGNPLLLATVGHQDTRRRRRCSGCSTPARASSARRTPTNWRSR